jgi:hypothetical protein
MQRREIRCRRAVYHIWNRVDNSVPATGFGVLPAEGAWHLLMLPAYLVHFAVTVGTVALIGKPPIWISIAILPLEIVPFTAFDCFLAKASGARHSGIWPDLYEVGAVGIVKKNAPEIAANRPSGPIVPSESMKFKTMGECMQVDPQIWNQHVEAFRERAREQFRMALMTDDDRRAEHWRLHSFILELDPRDWDGYGLLDRWEGEFARDSQDCSSGCAHYRPLKGELGSDWGVCTSPTSHRRGKLTFEHQGCYAFEPGPDAHWNDDE